MCPPEKINYIGYIFGFYATNNIPRDSRDTRPYLHRVQGQPWSFDGPYGAPKRDLTIFENF